MVAATLMVARRRNKVDLICLFLGLVLMSAGLGIMDFGTLLRMLGFREEAKMVIQDALAITLLAFALLMLSQPRMIIKPPGTPAMIDE